MLVIYLDGVNITPYYYEMEVGHNRFIFMIFYFTFITFILSKMCNKLSSNLQLKVDNIFF